MFIGSGLKALGSIPYDYRYIILFYFNIPFNYIYSLDARSKILLRYSARHHFTDTLGLGEEKFLKFVPIMLMHITGEKNAFDVKKNFLFPHLEMFPRVSLLPESQKKNCTPSGRLVYPRFFWGPSADCLSQQNIHLSRNASKRETLGSPTKGKL